MDTSDYQERKMTKNHFSRILLTFLLLLFLLPGESKANGFKIVEWAPEGTGMAGAWVAGAEGPSSIFYNPAGIVNQEGPRILLGGSFTTRQFSFFSPDLNLSVDSEKESFIIPSLAFSHQLNKNLWLGFGIYSPTNYRIEWPFTQRHPLVYSAREINLTVYNITPSIAWRISDRVSLGLNLGINYAAAYLRTHFDFDMMVTELTGGAVMDAEDFILTLDNCRKTSLSLTAGMQWHISKKLTFGVTLYGDLAGKFSVKRLEFKETDTPFPEVNEYLALFFKDSPEQNANLYFWDIPSIKAGLAWQVSRSVSLEIALFFDIWKLLDGIEINMDPEIIWWLPNPIEENYECSNTLSVRIGGEYRISPSFSLRIGYFNDPSPIPEATYSPAFPFADQWGVTLGIGYQHKQFSLDLAYRILVVEPVSVNNDVLEMWGIQNQEYARRNEHLFSISIGYRF